MNLRACIFLCAFLVYAAPLRAHHSAAAEYVADLSTWHAVITRFNWTNPHTFVYFDSKDPNGTLKHYECEGSAPSGLIGNGWTRTTIKPGDQVTIYGWRAKDHPEGCKIRAITLASGEKLYMGYVDESKK